MSLAAAANAATMTFGSSGWTDQNGADRATEWDVVITDIGVGAGYCFRVTASYSGGTNDGDILGIALAINASLTGAGVDVISLLDQNGAAITLPTSFCTVDCIGPGTDWAGGGGGPLGTAGTFGLNFSTDYGTGSSQGILLQTVVFDLDLVPDATFTAGLFTSAGLRLQTLGPVGQGADGSAKMFNGQGTFQACPDGFVLRDGRCFSGTGEEPPAAPLPAGLPLMLTAIGVGAYMRKRARKSA